MACSARMRFAGLGSAARRVRESCWVDGELGEEFGVSLMGLGWGLCGRMGGTDFCWNWAGDGRADCQCGEGGEDVLDLHFDRVLERQVVLAGDCCGNWLM